MPTIHPTSAVHAVSTEVSRAGVAVPLHERTSEELAVMAQRDNVAAFSELVVRFEARLFNFLLRRVARRVDAEDLTQDAFVRAWERIGSYNPTWRFSTWLFTIAARLAVSEHRKSRSTLAGEYCEHVESPRRDLDGEESDRRHGSHLWTLAVEVLRADQHIALWLRYAEDMSISEIATVLGKTKVGVRVCLFRARQSLAAAAGIDGVSQHDFAANTKGDGDRADMARQVEQGGGR